MKKRKLEQNGVVCFGEELSDSTDGILDAENKDKLITEDSDTFPTGLRCPVAISNLITRNGSAQIFTTEHLQRKHSFYYANS
jgi:hypothetical protein